MFVCYADMCRLCMDSWSGISLQKRSSFKFWSIVVLDGRASQTNSIVWNCDNSQKFSLGVIKSIRAGYNTTE